VTRIGLVGIGKIARDQHIPSLRAVGGFELVACASRNTRIEGVESFPTAEAMLAGCSHLDAVAICTPPQVHYEAAKLALSHGKHVLLEKPPCATIAELDRLVSLAREARLTLFQTWHSRHAAGVGSAKRWLSPRKIRAVNIIWREDVRHWHPGQTWIWEAGGFGIFDPGINAISILTEILAEPIFMKTADLFFPSNCEAPIAADLTMALDGGAKISAAFDFRQTGLQNWDIEIETDNGTLKLSGGGSTLFLDGVQQPAIERTGPHGEYESIYRHFAALIGKQQSDVDARPFQLVADAFLVGKRHSVEPFYD
jgi:predicted dehydrogenase